MIRFAEHLYVGETAARKKKKYIREIRDGKFRPDLYLITYSASDRDMLDIVCSVYLRQEALRKRLPEIVGIACGRSEALELVRKMVEDCFAAVGNCNVRDYLKSLETSKEEN
ncbi:hypothetical protein [Bilifractor porci]|jgi:hypothetical protein|uniref:Uncharacterized protein n=1 Tax=Bilifractor porci TaxID=2606636 RepID=A0A7X2P672_9FIRM|nr:hypothetical protein [Bilifractor porci]MST80944.1 hypothetical protein [Bilifractor porci]